MANKNDLFVEIKTQRCANLGILIKIFGGEACTMWIYVKKAVNEVEEQIAS